MERMSMGCLPHPIRKTNDNLSVKKNDRDTIWGQRLRCHDIPTLSMGGILS